MNKFASSASTGRRNPARTLVRRFFLPRLTAGFWIRAGAVALFAYLFFGYALLPFRVQGASMEPSYRDGEFNFCWRGRYVFSEPKRFEVAAVRFAGSRVMLLKRIVGLEGDEVEFREGVLYLNGRAVGEAYVRYQRSWNLPPRRVEKGNVFVVGDNRGVDIENHYLGQTSRARIIGGPVW
jgi:signal peptidase I